MADRPKKEIKTDEFADRLAGEHAKGMVKLVGRFLGNSERDGYYRLYLNEQLDRYLEFPKEATLEAERFGPERIVVWLKAGTQVLDTSSRPVPEEFLTGDIQRQNLPRATGLGGVVRPMMAMAAAAGDGCGSSIANCPDTQLSFTCNPRDPSPDCPFNKF